MKREIFFLVVLGLLMVACDNPLSPDCPEKQTAKIEGKILDADSSTSLPDVTVLLSTPFVQDAKSQSTTNATGTYQLQTKIYEQQLISVYAYKEGYKPLYSESFQMENGVWCAVSHVSISPGNTTACDFQFRKQ